MAFLAHKLLTNFKKCMLLHNLFVLSVINQNLNVVKTTFLEVLHICLIVCVCRCEVLAELLWELYKQASQVHS